MTVMRGLITTITCCLLLGLVGCASYSNDNYTPKQAQYFFYLHEGDFEKLMKETAGCTGNGLITIYSDAQVMKAMGDTISCSAKNEIASQLKSSGILWVNISNDEPYGKHGPMGAMFVLASHRTVVHGDGAAIYYFPELEVNPFGDSTSLLGKPGHWFFRSMKS